MAVEFTKRDRDYVGYDPRSPKIRWKKVSRPGKKFDVGGTIIELYPLKVFAEALDRTSDHAKKWMKAKYLPPPLYVVDGQKCKHWYSREQVVNVNRLMIARWRGRKYIQGEQFNQFVRDVQAVFYCRDVVVSEDGTISTETST